MNALEFLVTVTGTAAVTALIIYLNTIEQRIRKKATHQDIEAATRDIYNYIHDRLQNIESSIIQSERNIDLMSDAISEQREDIYKLQRDLRYKDMSVKEMFPDTEN